MSSFQDQRDAPANSMPAGQDMALDSQSSPAGHGDEKSGKDSASSPKAASPRKKRNLEPPDNEAEAERAQSGRKTRERRRDADPAKNMTRESEPPLAGEAARAAPAPKTARAARPRKKNSRAVQPEPNPGQRPPEQPEATPGQAQAFQAEAAPEPQGGEAAPAPENSGQPRRQDGEPSEARRKNRRGKRGGRGRGHKNPAAQESWPDNAPCVRSAVEIAREISRFPALPPGGQARDARAAEKPARKRAKSAAPKEAAAQPCKKRMFISVLPGEQVEVAIASEGVLLEYYLDMLHQRKIKGNIYKGVIHNIDSNLQAAFVDYGSGKNGFLQIDEVHPEYWREPHEPAREKKFPPIQKALKTGQEVLVQVVKEPAGSKGAFLTTWLSLAGRFLVLTPGQEQIGVSRKVTDQEERVRLRDMMNGIDPGNGLGVIVRTVGEGATKTTLKNDLQYLKRLWRDIRKKATEVTAPALVHQEPGLSERAVRDYLTDDVGEIWVDNEDEARNVAAMANLLFPRKKNLVRMHEDISLSLWDRFNLARQLEQIYGREVGLPSGGRLVFDQTEALMAIDINSGKISGKNNFEDMAFKTNMEAAEAIARQLRLRDIGGQVVIDFIEMRDKKHILEVEKALRQAMKSDRARHDVSRMSSFGLLELVRQRIGSSALSICMETCAACGGTGQRRNMEWQALQALRGLRRKLPSCPGPKYVFETARELGLYLLNFKRDALRMLERDFGKTLEIRIQI